MNPLERKGEIDEIIYKDEIIDKIVRNGGFPEPHEFGAYRRQLPNETVKPKHVENINGTPHVPVRIYGPKPQEVQGNRKISPMPQPIFPKYTSNNLLPTT